MSQASLAVPAHSFPGAGKGWSLAPPWGVLPIPCPSAGGACPAVHPRSVTEASRAPQARGLSRIDKARVSLCQEFLPLLEKAAKGAGQEGLSCSRAAVINVSTKLGSIGLCLGVLEAPMYPYRASKVRCQGVVLAWRCLFQAAQNMVTRCMAAELQDKGILCTAIHPGWVKTDMGTQKVLGCAGEGRQDPCCTPSSQGGQGRLGRGMLYDAVGCQDHLLGWSRQGAGSKLPRVGIASPVPPPSTESRRLAAPLTVERSVRGILAVLASLSQDTSGAFLDWEGNSLPW
ncbi:uncharacterized protein LOC141963921 [Athene noctua]|uniref:uncharacterized protein LOC141963921 n=1 Tax=Athene noctua TaxID=126797 RepID=UPI003EBE665A